jgi:nicotinamide-nucleotide amidase
MTQNASITDLAAEIVRTARKSGALIITAESCTAGSLATLIADTPGAGDVLLGGFVTYAKLCKTELLGIPAARFASCSAVSAEIAGAMTQGALERCRAASHAVAVTCVGGPEPDEDGNPVGLSYIAAQHRDAAPTIRRLHIEEVSSGRIRGRVLAESLGLLLAVIKGEVRHDG